MAIVALGIILFVASKMIKKKKPKAEAKAHEQEAAVQPAEQVANEKPEAAHVQKHAHMHKK